METNFQLGLHEFLRYAIPGYIYLLVFLLPIVLTNPPPIESNSLFFSALLALAGLIVGYILFHIYYPIFMRFFYATDRTPPFTFIRGEVEALACVRDRREIESLTRAIEDLVLNDPSLKRFEKERERIQFLFSSFHSIGTTIVAIYLAIISLVIWEALTKTPIGGGLIGTLPLAIGCRVLQSAMSPICWSIAPFSSFFAFFLSIYWVFLSWSICWVLLSLLLFEGWVYRKDLAIMEEFLLVTQNKYELESITYDAISTFNDNRKRAR